MTYKALYDSFAGHQGYVPRNAIRDKVLEITGAPGVRILATTLDKAFCRGLYISARNVDHPLVRQFGGHVIAFDRTLNRCWQRFVVVKELMHMLDGQNSATDNGDKFDSVLSSLSGVTAPGASNQQHESEVLAWWKALAIFCPEAARLELAEELRRGHTTEYAVALRLRIPQLYVMRLFKPMFLTAKNMITN